MAQQINRFEYVGQENVWDDRCVATFYYFRDTVTGVYYVTPSNREPLTPLLDADGKPVTRL